MSSPILDMENIYMRLGPSNMGRCGNGKGVHFGVGYYAPPYCVAPHIMLKKENQSVGCSRTGSTLSMKMKSTERRLLKRHHLPSSRHSRRGVEVGLVDHHVAEVGLLPHQM